MSNLIADSVIEDDLLQQHKRVTLEFRGKKTTLYFNNYADGPCTIS